MSQNKNLIKIHIMIGIPGSGKSTYAVNHVNKVNGVIISSDDIREEFGNTWTNEEVFNLVYRLLKDAIVKDVKDIYVDATNLTFKNRKKYFSIINPYKEALDISVIAEVMTTSLSTSIFRNENRKRKVPVDVIVKYDKILQMPTKEEGFDVINYHGKEEK